MTDKQPLSIIDYRNARYQGVILHDKFEGLGIVMDDEINLCCCQWKQGKINGKNVLLLNDGTYFYGEWVEGQPHGINVYRNKQFIIYAKYQQGKPVQQAIAVSNALDFIAVFNAQQILDKNSTEWELNSSQSIIQVDYFQEYLTHTAQKIGLILERQEATLSSYLNKLAILHPNHLIYKQISVHSYFGYQNGLGIKFSLTLGTQQLLKISIGHHTNYKLTEIGVKYYQYQGIQEGNFTTKEIISYNKYSKRPKEKSQLIFQNIHKRSLNFLNQYFEMRKEMMQRINTFLEDVFSKKVAENESKKVVKSRIQQKIIPTDREQFYQEAKDNYQKVADKIRNRQATQNKKSTSSIIKNNQRSKSLYRDKSRSKNQVTERNTQKKKINNNETIRVVVDDLIKVKGKDLGCQRCREKERKSVSKSAEKNRSKYQKVDTKKEVSKTKEIKYLKDYGRQIDDKECQQKPKNSQRQKTQGSLSKRQQGRISSRRNQVKPSNTEQDQEPIESRKPVQRSKPKLTSKSTNNIPNKKQSGQKDQKNNQKQKNLEEIQYQNQIKIQQEILRQERERLSMNRIRNTKSQIQDVFEQINAMNQEIRYNDLFSREQLYRRKYSNQFQPEYYQRSRQSRELTPKQSYSQLISKPHANKRYIQSQNTQYMDLQNKREKILKDLQKLNYQFDRRSRTSHSGSPPKTQKQITLRNMNQNNSMATQLQQSYHQNQEGERRNRQKIEEEFNRKYRNYIIEPQKEGQRSCLNNEVYRYESPRMVQVQPEVSCFSQNQPSEYQLTSNKNDSFHRKKRYEYLFQK